MVPRLLLAGLTAMVLGGLAAAPASAATVYGGGSVPESVNDPIPLFLVSIDDGRGRIVGRSGGACSQGSFALAPFATHAFKVHRRGRFALKGSFTFNVAGGVGSGTYRFKGRVRPGRGLVTGTASVRLRFPTTTPGQTVSCKSGKRAFRTRKPGSKPRKTRGPFYGVTSQGLPIVLRPTPDASVLAPAAIWTTIPCPKFGPMSAAVRLRVPATAPGVYTRTGAVNSSGFVGAAGSTVPIPAGTYDYTTYGLQTTIVNGRATGTITASSKIGNAQKILVDTCAVPPITFTAIP